MQLSLPMDLSRQQMARTDIDRWAEAMTKPDARPRMSLKIVRETAARMLLPRVMEWLDSPDETHDPEDVLKDLIKCWTDEGYEFARDLDNRCGWACDRDLVEELDSAGHYEYTVHEQLVAAWVRAHGITVPFTLGDQVTVKVRDDAFKLVEHRGEIIAIDASHAKCTVMVPALGHVREGVGTHGVILPVEEITPVASC